MRQVLLIFVCVMMLQYLEAKVHDGNTCQELDAFSILQLSNPDLDLHPDSKALQDAFSHGLPMMLNATAVAVHPSNVQAVMVPKVVHHTYKYDISHGPWPNRIWQTSFLAWKTFFPEPEYRHEFWNDERTSSFIQTECSEFSSAFAGIGRDIVKSDFSRYCILWKLGGIYADLDYMPLRNFYSDLKPGMVSLLQSPYQGETYQNSLMASPPGDMYWEQLMQLALHTLHARDVVLAAGPRLLDLLPLTHNESWINTLPCNEFQRVTHIETPATSLHKSRLKGCQSLVPADIDDMTLKGIHWGTISYSSKSGSHVHHSNSGLADQIWQEFWEYVQRPPRTLGVGPTLEQKELRHSLLIIFKEADG